MLRSDTCPRTLRTLWDQRRYLNDRAPVTITVPSGHSIPIDYVAGEIPVLAVKLQEMFGLADTPTIAGGRINFVGTACPGAGRGRRLPQRISNTPPEPPP